MARSMRSAMTRSSYSGSGASARESTLESGYPFCGPARDTHFFAGTLAKRQHQFVLLGAFWPPKRQVPQKQELALF